MCNNFQIIIILIVFFISLLSNGACSDLSLSVNFGEKLKKKRFISIEKSGIMNVSMKIPNWSYAILDGQYRYLETLIIVDKDVADYYGGSIEKIKKDILELIKVVNMYYYQLDLRLVLVDVQIWSRKNASLSEFLDYRTEKRHSFVSHDLAMLMRYKYPGGIAYVNGICGHSAVGISGFSPAFPQWYAGVFVHELAHLLGLSHNDVTPCKCPGKNDTEPCLQVQGFSYECSVQALVAISQLHRCLSLKSFMSSKTVVAHCGNGVVEPGEDCDCGPQDYCHDWNCPAGKCRKIVSNFAQYCLLCISLFLICWLFIFTLGLVRRQKSARKLRNLSAIQLAKNDFLANIIDEKNAVSTDQSIIIPKLRPIVNTPIRKAPSPPMKLENKPDNREIQKAKEFWETKEEKRPPPIPPKKPCLLTNNFSNKYRLDDKESIYDIPSTS